MPPNQRHRVLTTPDFMNFDDEPDDIPKEGPQFVLLGETFHCVPMCPMGALPRLTRILGVNERGVPVSNPDVLRFMEDVICEERLVTRPAPVEEGAEEGDAAQPTEIEVWESCDDLERWRAMLDDKRRPVSAEKLVKIIRYLMEWYSDRPTGPSEQ